MRNKWERGDLFRVPCVPDSWTRNHHHTVPSQRRCDPRSPTLHPILRCSDGRASSWPKKQRDVSRGRIPIHATIETNLEFNVYSGHVRNIASLYDLYRLSFTSVPINT